MPANVRPWAIVITIGAIVLIVLSLMFLAQQLQNAPVPAPAVINQEDAEENEAEDAENDEAEGAEENEAEENEAEDTEDN